MGTGASAEPGRHGATRPARGFHRADPASGPALLLPFRHARDHRPGARHRPRPGCDLCRRAGRPAPRRVDRRQERRPGGRLLPRERGVRRPRPRRRSVGLRGQPRPHHDRGGSGRRPGRPDRAGVRDRAPSARGARRPPARPRPVRDRRGRGPVRGAAGGQDRRPARGGCGPSTRRRDRVHRFHVRRAARVEDVRRDGRQLHGTGDHPRRVGHRGERGGRRRAAAPQLPRLGGRLAGRRLRAHPLPGAGRERRAGRDGGGPAPLRSEVAAGAPDHRPPPLAALPPDPRELRPSNRAGPRLRHRGQLCRDELPDHRQARGRLPLRLGADRHRRRRHRAGRDGHVRLGRRGRRGAGRSARAGRAPRRLPQQPRDRAADRPRVRGRDAGRRLEPDPAHPDDEHQPAAEAGHELRRDHRRHRRRPPARPQPELVDRRPAPQLPVRHRAGLGDQGRQAGPALPQRDLHRDHARVLGELRRRRATRRAT